MAFDTYNAVKLADLPKGEFFTVSEGSESVYRKGEYDRSTKGWFCPKVDDISVERLLKGTKVVYTGFTY